MGLAGPSGVTQPNPLPKQGHPEQAAQDLVQAGLEYLQRRRLHSPSGQPGPGLRHPEREESAQLEKKIQPAASPPRRSRKLRVRRARLGNRAGVGTSLRAPFVRASSPVASMEPCPVLGGARGVQPLLPLGDPGSGRRSWQSCLGRAGCCAEVGGGWLGCRQSTPGPRGPQHGGRQRPGPQVGPSAAAGSRGDAAAAFACAEHAETESGGPVRCAKPQKSLRKR